MPKQPVTINFSQGLDKKTDPYQVAPGKFLSLVNSNFTTGGRLTKRNGFGPLPSPSKSNLLTTFTGNATAIGTQVESYSPDLQSWINGGSFYPCNLSVLPIVRNSLNQTQADSAIASNGALCVGYCDQNPASLSSVLFKFGVFDSTTGQQLLAPQVISDADTSGPYGYPRVFIVGNYFMVVYVANISSTFYLKYIPIAISNLTVGTPGVITNSIAPSPFIAFEGAVYNNTLYMAWDGASTSGIKMAYINSQLVVSSTVTVDSSHVGQIFTVCVDVPNQTIWVSYFNVNSNHGYSVAVDPLLNILLAHVESITSGTILNLASSAQNNVLSLFYEVSNNYSYDSAIPTHYVEMNTLTIGGTLGTASTLIRSLGLGSKTFSINGVIYFLGAYQSPYQSTYFLVNSENSNVIAEIAYENGGGYVTHGLPSVTVVGESASVAYLYKDFIESVSNANSAGTSVVGGVYSQTGVNQATFIIGTTAQVTTVELGSNLNITAGFLAAYDGTQVTEQGFFLYPDSIEVAASATSGSMSAQQYYYQVIYEWSDNKGNIFRSAPSIPVGINLSGDTSVLITGPMLRLTYKANVRISIFRWSAGQQNYYEVNPVSSPTLIIINSTTSDSWIFTDSLADSSIVGNSLIYTTGGVVEDIGGPSFVSIFTFDDRLWGITAEDQNLLWFSKQVIEATPVELSDLLTLYVAPSLSVQGNTGSLTCGAPMDDKLILFKGGTGGPAIYYINGTGPDNTGSNSQYSAPTFITSMVGCSNQASIVFQPNGLMFEFASEAGNQIWLLGRDLSTQYIGAAVEEFTLNATVTSAVAIPGTNQVRISLSSGITIVYDYFYQQWSTFNLSQLSGTIYQGLHTYLDSFNRVFQETPGIYLDGSTPVLISFVTGWMGLAGLRGYERIHEFSFLGNYYSPHKLAVQVAFDYGAPSQQSIYSPPNYSPNYGQSPYFGSDNPYGGMAIENFRVFTKTQKCKAFQIQVQEIFDPSYGTAAGQGVSLSGINMVVSFKKGWAPVAGRNSVG